MIATLKANHYKMTPQRLAIIKILSGKRGHLSVEEIYDEIKHGFPTISLATIYKNLSDLKDLGEISEVWFSDGGNRYDVDPSPHTHVICTKCKEIVDAQMEILEDIEQKVSQETGFRVTYHRITFFGVCPDCQRKEKLP
jgi:Fur family peroxide stress response transcriptional regulator